MKTTQQDVKSMKLCLNEATDHGGSESQPATLETDVYVWCYALIVVLHDRNQ